MINNCFYNKIKLLHDLSCNVWFIERHAKEDAKKAGDDECLAFLEHLQKDLEKHAQELKKMVCKTCK